jgi:hypothetical protein
MKEKAQCSPTAAARLDSVVTRPAALAARGGMGKTNPHKSANWLLGKTAPLGRGHWRSSQSLGTDGEVREETLDGEELGGTEARKSLSRTLVMFVH